MSIGQNLFVTTQELIDFARRHNAPLGRKNPRRTLNYYIRLGLLPPRDRTSDGRFRWGFPAQAKTVLLRIRDLKRRGLTLRQIREALEQDLREIAQALKRRAAQPRLREGFPPTPEPQAEASYEHADWDYTDHYHEMQAVAALEALDRGDMDTVREVLREMLELAQRVRAGHRFKGIIDGAPDMKLGPADLRALIRGSAITLRAVPVDPASPPRPDVEALAHSDEAPEALRTRGVDPGEWSRMSLEERRATAAFIIGNLENLRVLPQGEESQTLGNADGGTLPPTSPVAAGAPAQLAESRVLPLEPVWYEKRIKGRLPGDWPSLGEGTPQRGKVEESRAKNVRH